MAADSEPEFNILSDILDTRDGNFLVVVIVKSQRAKIKNQSQAKLALWHESWLDYNSMVSASVWKVSWTSPLTTRTRATRTRPTRTRATRTQATRSRMSRWSTRRSAPPTKFCRSGLENYFSLKTFLPIFNKSKRRWWKFALKNARLLMNFL